MILSLQNLTKTYNGVAAVDGIDLNVEPGSLVVILGPAGAGKTTTLRMIAGLEAPDRGTINIAGREMTGVPPNGRDIAMIFDNLALYPQKTGFENIAFPLRVARRPAEEIDSKVNAIARMLRIPHVLQRLPKTMSGGEKQRVALGRALIRKPALFLLDEPLSSLDAMLRLELRAELRRLQAEHSYTFLMATPDYAEALAIADVVVVLDKGRILQIGDPQKIYDEPIDRDTARFVGAPEINLLRTNVVREKGSVALGEIEFRVPPLLLARVPPSSRSIDLGIRPEDVIVGLPSSGGMAGQVLDVEPLGLQSIATMAVPGGQLLATIGADAPVKPLVGDQVGINFRDARLHAFDPVSGQRF